MILKLKFVNNLMSENRLELTINNDIFIVDDIDKKVYKKSLNNNEKMMCEYSSEFYDILNTLCNKTKTKSYVCSKNGQQSECDFLSTFNDKSSKLYLEKSGQECYPFKFKNGDTIVKSKTFHQPLIDHLNIIPVKCIRKKSDFKVVCRETNEIKSNIELKTNTYRNVKNLPSDLEIINSLSNINFLELYKYSGDSKLLTNEMITNGNISARNILKSLRENCKVEDYVYQNTHIVYKVTYPLINTTKYVFMEDILKNVHLKFDINKGSKSIDRVVVKLGRIKNKKSIKVYDNIDEIINYIDIIS